MSDDQTTSAEAPASTFRNVMVLLAIAVAAAGFFLVRARMDARIRQLGLSDPEAKKHLVTEPMTKNAASYQDKPAPAVELTDSAGEPVSLRELTKEKPVVLYFVKDGCPCSETYEPFLQELARNYADVVTVLAIIDGTRETAQAWSSRFVLPYRIAFDPKSETMARWGATNSAYTALVDKEGKLVAYWPGYSRWMLEELSQKISEIAGVPRRRLAILDAPSQLYTGCSFGTEDPSQIVVP